jgi:hypothetical protein
LYGGLPIKGYFEAYFKEGKPIGSWVTSDTIKSKDGTKFEYNSFTVEDGKIVGSTRWQDQFSNAWTNLTFDEDGLINCCDKFIHGWYKQNYREDVDPTLGIYYHEDDDEIYIVWNKFYINVFSKQHSSFNDFPRVLERFQRQFQVVKYFVDTEYMPMEDFTFAVGYNYARANQEEMDKFLAKWKNTEKEELSLSYYNLLQGMNSYQNDDYYKARDQYLEAQKLCGECALKGVIENKITEVKELVF